MLSESWLSKYFKVIGDRKTHFGAFDCGCNSIGNMMSAASSGSSESQKFHCSASSLEPKEESCGCNGGCCGGH